MNTNSNLEMRKIKSLYFLYEISEDGRIIRNVKSKKQIKQIKNNRGYWMFSVMIKGQRHYLLTHRTVAECWLQNFNEELEIDHIDKNVNNNHYSNLRCVTHSENNLNRYISWNQPVRIYNSEEDMIFDKSKDAAEYISTKLSLKYNTVRWKLSKKRKYINGYNIEYLRIAETGHDDSTE